jgi:hypothetical protein
VSIGRSDVSGGYTAYVDPNTVRRKGNLVKMWSLRDFKTRQSNGRNSYFSTKSLDEFDCTEEQLRTHAVYIYPGQMGTGEAVYFNTDLDDKWVPVMPDSMGEAKWEAACGKK